MELLEKILYLLITVPLIYLISGIMIKSKLWRWIFIIAHSFFLTLMALFVFNKPDWSWTHSISDIRTLSNSNNKSAYQFIENNFILADNSFDKTLLPNPDGDSDDSTSIIVTNRNSLTSFLKLLKENQENVDLVVLDIGLNKAIDDNSQVQQVLTSLYSDSKIIISINPGDPDAFRPIKNNSVYGNISEEGSDKLFATHQINYKETFSLAYKLYAFLNNVKVRNIYKNDILLQYDSSGLAIANNIFFPEFSMTNEKRLTGIAPTNYQYITPDIDTGYEKSVHNYYLLSQTLSGNGSEFSSNLKQRRKEGKKNIIFIGSFGSKFEDSHQTVYGNLHGPTIILNILYALRERSHIISAKYIFILFTGFLLISIYLVYYSFQLPFLRLSWGWLESLKKNTTINWVNWVKKFILFPFFEYVFVEEFIYVALFAMIYLCFRTGRVPNVLVLIIYFGILRTGIQYRVKKMESKRQPHKK